MDGFILFSCALVSLVPTNCKITGERDLPMMGMTQIIVIEKRSVRILPEVRDIWNQFNRPIPLYEAPKESVSEPADDLFPYLYPNMDFRNILR